MIHTESHETFLSFGELFSRSAQRILDSEMQVRQQIDTTDSPYCTAMKLVADAEHQLAADLAHYAKQGPENIICTRIQYVLENDPLPVPATPEDALQNITRINTELAEVLKNLSEKSAPDTLQQTIETLRRDVEQVNKKISMIRLTVQDL